MVTVAGLVAMSLAGGAALTGCGDGTAAPPPAQGDVAGRSLFLAACASCHGNDGAGKPGIADPIPTAITFEEVADVIRNGTGDMAGFPDLDDEQVAAIARYVSGD